MNPWIDTRSDENMEITPAPKKQDSVLPEVCGPMSPQNGVVIPKNALPISTKARNWPGLCVLGVHGGAGESTLASLRDNWVAAEHVWPDPTSIGVPVVLVARSNMNGLQQAQLAARQWAGGALPHINLLGLVIMADSPGRLPRPLRDFEKIVKGGLPRSWNIDWVESWRFGLNDDPPRSVSKVVSAIEALL